MTLPWSSSSYFPEVFIRLTVPVHFAEVEQTSGHNYPPLGGLWLLPAVFIFLQGLVPDSVLTPKVRPFSPSGYISMPLAILAFLHNARGRVPRLNYFPAYD